MVSKLDTSGILSPHLLAHGSALSTVNQRNLGSLLQDIAVGSRRLVIIAGAGIAMDAGLPSWPELVRRLEEDLKPDVRARLSILGSSDLQRRAQQVFYHLSQGRRLHPDWGQLKSALYRGAGVQPGEMAQALARLVGCYRGDVELLTTNFDGVLEAAYDAHGMTATPFSITGTSGPQASHYDLSEWVALTPLQRSMSILHVHGMLDGSDGTQPLLPLVLTETDFSEHGRLIRDTVASRLHDATVLLVGLSMTDPNVLGPLRDTKTSDGNRYLLTVPDLFASQPDLGDSPLERRNQCAQYGVESSAMLATDLNLRPVLLKSYGQVVQVLSDLSLAHLEPERFEPHVCPASRRLVYGSRFTKALSATYKAIGYRPKTGAPGSQHAAEDVSRSLRSAANGPLRLLRRWRQLELHGHVASSEDFGFFLWLRDPCATRDAGSYRVRLIASSTYFHWDAWSGQNIQEVSPRSSYTPALAVFHGRATMSNIEPERRRNWQGSLAVPLFQQGSGSMVAHNGVVLDRLTLGAISVNTTRPVEFDGSAEPEHCSVLAHINPQQMSELQVEMAKMAARVFSPR